MGSSPMHQVALACHAASRSHAVARLGARVSRTSGGILSVAYTLEGHLDRLQLPAPRPARFADGLWQHTCFELFIARPGRPAYHEFNFAACGEWAAYAFARYREAAPLAADQLDPRITVHRKSGALELEASIRLDRLSPSLCSARLALALSTVIEDGDGGLSYWALHHPPGPPDFHHPDAFILELDEIRH
jgi:hypothetical protein